MGKIRNFFKGYYDLQLGIKKRNENKTKLLWESFAILSRINHVREKNKTKHSILISSNECEF